MIISFRRSWSIIPGGSHTYLRLHLPHSSYSSYSSSWIGSTNRTTRKATEATAIRGICNTMPRVSHLDADVDVDAIPGTVTRETREGPPRLPPRGSASSPASGSAVPKIPSLTPSDPTLVPKYAIRQPRRVAHPQNHTHANTQARAPAYSGEGGVNSQSQSRPQRDPHHQSQSQSQPPRLPPRQMPEDFLEGLETATVRTASASTLAAGEAPETKAGTRTITKIPHQTRVNELGGHSEPGQTGLLSTHSAMSTSDISPRVKSSIRPITTQSTATSSSLASSSRPGPPPGQLPLPSQSQSQSQSRSSSSLVTSTNLTTDSSFPSALNPSWRGGFLAKAKSGVDYLNVNTKTYRSAIANSGRSLVKNVAEVLQEDEVGFAGEDTEGSKDGIRSSGAKEGVVRFIDTDSAGSRAIARGTMPTSATSATATGPETATTSSARDSLVAAANAQTRRPLPPAKEQSWSSWAGSKLVGSGGAGSSGGSIGSVVGESTDPKAQERIELMPGWVVWKHRDQKDGKDASGNGEGGGVQAFDLEVTTSGFTASWRSMENATRSQRIFMRIAKGFAALPRVPESISGVNSATESSTPLLGNDGEKLSEEPERLEAYADSEAEESGEDHQVRWKGTSEDGSEEGGQEGSQLRNSVNEKETMSAQTTPKHSMSLTPTSTSTVGTPPPRRSSTAKTAPTGNTALTSTTKPQKQNSSGSFLSDVTPDQLKIYHKNLDARLEPFWSSVSTRRIQLSIYPVAVRHSPISGEDEMSEPGPDDEPLIRNVFSTTSQGLFAQRLTIPWERILSHGPSLKMAFAKPPSTTYGEDVKKASEPGEERWALHIKAEVLAEGTLNGLNQSPISTPSRSGQAQPQSVATSNTDTGATAFFATNAEPMTNGSGGRGGGLENTGKTAVMSKTVTPLARDGGIRVLSDLDDTVKISNILSGAREVFRNAFCKPVTETCVPGMPELYWQLVTEGVAGFHYCSNSPYELLPIIRDFFSLHEFPKGYSLALKYYGGKNLFNGLFEPPAERKKPKVVDVLDSFPNTKFVLFGDSGEQDLELYVAIAKERPEQVLAIAIRDITTPSQAEEIAASALARTSSITFPTTAKSTPVTPTRERPSGSGSVDVKALNEAIGGINGTEQAANAGLIGTARETARRMVGAQSDVNFKELKMSNLSQDKKQTPEAKEQEIPTDKQEQSKPSTSSVTTVSESPTSQSKELPTSTVRRARNSTESVNTHATAETTTSTETATDLLAKAASKDQLKTQMANMTSLQQKILRRSLEWGDRMNKAIDEVPLGVRLFFFAEPRDIEEQLVKVVRDERRKTEMKTERKMGERVVVEEKEE